MNTDLKRTSIHWLKVGGGSVHECVRCSVVPVIDIVYYVYGSRDGVLDVNVTSVISVQI